jgi:hypothetical protein
MMASGEIRLSTTTMRRMPVLAQSGCYSLCLPSVSEIGEAASAVAPVVDLLNEVVQSLPDVPPTVSAVVENANNVVQGLAAGNDVNNALEGNPAAAVQTAVTATEFAVAVALPRAGGPMAILNSAFQTLNNYFTFAVSAAYAQVNAMVEDYRNLTY